MHRIYMVHLQFGIRRLNYNYRTTLMHENIFKMCEKLQRVQNTALMGLCVPEISYIIFKITRCQSQNDEKNTRDLPESILDSCKGGLPDDG